jgi:2,5-dihydroxypyridine 5,6-dioxygenase
VRSDRIEAKWIDAFERVFELCRVRRDENVAILSETQSRPVLVHLAELALARAGAVAFHLVVPSPPETAPVPVRSTGASRALAGHTAALAALEAADMVVDLTVEGILHAPELGPILRAKARVLMISNEHPEALERLVPSPEMEDKVKAAVRRCRDAQEMRVVSAAGTDLVVAMTGASTAGVWGWTDRPGTVAHWPGGIVVSFPKAGSVEGRLVLDAGDVNLTFKRYLERPVVLTIEDDHVTSIEGDGTDAELMRR